MATKKKTKKKATKSKRTAVKKAAPPKKQAKKAKPARKVVKRKPAPKKAPAKRAAPKKTSGVKKPARKTSQPKELTAFLPVGPGSDSAGQSGDLQGLSNVEGADSESVDELVEEGNAFEADVVAGVEDAGDTEEREVRTHEVPEDDVPAEYLDEE